MPEETNQNNVPGGDSAEGGAEGQKTDFVGRDSYVKAVDEAKSAKRRAAEAQARANELEAKFREQEEQKMLEEKNYSDLIERLKGENQQLSEQVQNHVKDKTDFRKMTAAMELLKQKGVNLESKYMGLLDIEAIQLTDDGDIDPNSVTEVVSTFQKEHPRLTIPTARLLPNLKSGDSVSKMSIEEFKKLSPAEATKAIKEGRVDNPWLAKNG